MMTCFSLAIAGTGNASKKKRNYDDNYLDFGIASIINKGAVKP